MRLLFILLVLGFGFAKSQAQIFNGNQNDLDIILKNTENFSKYIMASNYDKIAASYTNDAKIFPNKSKILEGEAIKTYWTLPEGLQITHHKIFQSEVTVIEDTAYDYGYYEGRTKNAKGEEQSWEGKYVIVWKKVGDDWRMYLDIWNNTN